MFDLREKTNKLEDGIITLSGPALAISGIIAGVDLLTGGTWMQQWPWLTFAWAVCLLLTLDFQVLSLGARVHHIYLDSKKGGWRKAGEIALAVLIAAAISYVSIQMQSIIARANSVTGLSIADATAQLGINPLALIWERSALVLVLIFLSGWFREEVKRSSVSPSKGETNTSISDETTQIILAKLAKLDLLEQAFNQQKVEVTSIDVPQIAAPEQSETEEEQINLQAQLERLLTMSPDITSRDAAAIVGKPHSTVYRHMSRVKQQMEQI